MQHHGHAWQLFAHGVALNLAPHVNGVVAAAEFRVHDCQQVPQPLFEVWAHVDACTTVMLGRMVEAATHVVRAHGAAAPVSMAFVSTVARLAMLHGVSARVRQPEVCVRRRGSSQSPYQRMLLPLGSVAAYGSRFWAALSALAGVCTAQQRVLLLASLFGGAVPGGCAVVPLVRSLLWMSVQSDPVPPPLLRVCLDTAYTLTKQCGVHHQVDVAALARHVATDEARDEVRDLVTLIQSAPANVKHRPRARPVPNGEQPAGDGAGACNGQKPPRPVRQHVFEEVMGVLQVLGKYDEAAAVKSVCCMSHVDTAMHDTAVGVSVAGVANSVTIAAGDAVAIPPSWSGRHVACVQAALAKRSNVKQGTLFVRNPRLHVPAACPALTRCCLAQYLLTNKGITLSTLAREVAEAPVDVAAKFVWAMGTG